MSREKSVHIETVKQILVSARHVLNHALQKSEDYDSDLCKANCKEALHVVSHSIAVLDFEAGKAARNGK